MTMSQEILTPDVLGRLNSPTDKAVCLPNAAYTSQAFLEDECRVLFAKEWAFAGVGAQIPKRGDLAPVSVGGQELLLVRNKSGEVKAFYNVCRHRGMRLASCAQSGRAAIMCPYHAWTYSLDGELRKTPHFGGHDIDIAPGFDKREYGLVPVRCELWHDLIFVNIEGAAPALAECMAPLDKHWRHYDFGLLRHGGSSTFEVNTNWKLAIENYLESYHLPWTHPTLNSSSALQAHYCMVEPTFMGQGSYHYDSASVGHGDLPMFPKLSKKARTVAEYPYLLPNLMLGIHPSYFFVFGVQPLAPDRTLELFHFYFVGDEALRADLAPQRDKAIDLWLKTNREDIIMIEGMQRGRHSLGYRDGRFSPYHEVTTHEFQRRVANKLAGAIGRATAA